VSAALRRQRRTWPLFLAGSAVLVVAMAALSAALLRGESREHASRVAQMREATARQAVHRMDDWLAPVLAREAGRHHSDYAAYREPRRVFSTDLERLPAGSVLEPSPLLGFRSETILLHLQWSLEDGLSSPQVPLAKERELALSSGVPAELLEQVAGRLRAAEERIDFAALASTLPPWPGPPWPVPAGRLDEITCASPDELRESAAGPGLVEDAGTAAVGVLTSRLLPGDELVLARRVRLGETELMQVVLLDRPALEAYLLETAKLPGATLMSAGLGSGPELRGLPYRVALQPAPLPKLGWTDLRTGLAFGWLAGLVCLVAGGWSLRRGLLDAERRTRFAAAVSHELRTPLTTLQLYSEMLADGVVSDPQARQEYLETIQAESGRLASLVENVLLHARLERTGPPELKRLAVSELLDSIEPVLRRRAAEAGRPFDVAWALDRDAEVEVDRDAVERVLFNLVDNACKHAAGAEDPSLKLELSRRGSFVDLQVSDHGPGIPRALGSAVFEAFRRGGEEGAPGAGLGLNLSQSLARELQGELSLVPSESGACFRLSLRLA
jgi:signal transduction histidine kinase